MSGLVPVVVVWWLALAVIGWAAVPVAYTLFRGLPDRGMAFARPIGLLAVAYLYWWGGLSRIVPNSGAGAAFVVVVWVAFGLWLARRRPEVVAFVRAHRRTFLAYEALFAVAFVAWAVYRATVPNIEPAGGEKYMEMAFIDGILASPGFPPNDPWLSGRSLSYYYMGYLMGAQLIHLTGVLPYAGFNLMIPMSLAMTLTGAAGIGWNLAALTPGAGAVPRWITAGLAGTLTAVMGNLEAFLEVAYRRGVGSPRFWNYLDIRNLTLRGASGLPGQAAQLIGCSAPETDFGAGGWLPTRFIWWWRSSRVIHDSCNEIIHEFPFFSFMLGDVHPHVMALPFGLVVVGLALSVLAGSDGPLPEPGTGSLWSPQWLGVALVVGALGFLNAWDLPAYAGVVVVAFGLWIVRRRPSSFSWEHRDAVLTALFAAILALPVYRLFLASAGIVAPALGRGPLGQPFVGGVALAAAVASFAAVWWALRVLLARAAAPGTSLPSALHLLRFTVWLGLVAIALYLPFYAPLESQVEGVGIVGAKTRLVQWLVHFGPLTFLAGSLVVAAIAGLSSSGRRLAAASWLVMAAAAPIMALSFRWPAAGLMALLAAAAGVAAIETWRRSAGPTGGSGAAVALTFALVLAAVGFALPLAIEFVFVRDLFNSRMNSVFKFYYQGWVLLALAGAYAPVMVFRRWRQGGLAWVWAAPAALLVVAGLVFPVASVATRSAGWRGRNLTLNGLGWWQQFHPASVAAAEWLLANADGTPVVVEAAGDSYEDENRISLATGFPTILGWNFHERQWGRDVAAEIEPRLSDLKIIYTSRDASRVLPLLAKYEARYLVVGPAERAQYELEPEDAAWFDAVLPEVFEAGGLAIYEVPR
ncbi:MAG: DUF2298 domain-containing protein [Anaerolineae bacterium]